MVTCLLGVRVVTCLLGVRGGYLSVRCEGLPVRYLSVRCEGWLPVC